MRLSGFAPSPRRRDFDGAGLLPHLRAMLIPIVDAKFKTIRPKAAWSYGGFGRTLTIIRWVMICGAAAFGVTYSLIASAR